MNLKATIPKPERAVALVVTLLMLAVITFLAVAFLAMTSRDRSAVNASLDVDTARAMSDAALARAQSEIIAQMMIPPGDIMRYDYMASHNYLSPGGFNGLDTIVPDSNNVCYDTFITNGGSGANPQNWAQNIANLFFDPRPPVFITTGPQATNDFRFWVDINRNGRFETNGSVNSIPASGIWDGVSTSVVNGEPEWIGVLKYPEYMHSATNPFIGRYAYMVLPVGKMLDLNYIYNHSKYTTSPKSDANMLNDGFIRDEGVGSWELNLGALINDLGPEFQTNTLYAANPYTYIPSSSITTPIGAVNYEASQFLAYRYGYNSSYPQTLVSVFGTGTNLNNLNLNAIDWFGSYNNYPSLTYPFDYSYGGSIVAPAKSPWPGTYNSNMYYDLQDVFDQTKTDPNFVSNLVFATGQIDTVNRYTYQRLLSCIGTGSSPDYGVYVYSNFFSTNVDNPTSPGYVPIPQPSWLRTKVNINYNNTAQIQTGPYSPYGSFTPMPTNLVPWQPLAFFTSAADLLLRSQIFKYTNWVTNTLGIGAPAGYIYTNFSLTNIPIYDIQHPGIVYNEDVHRMLQLAANIYAAAYSNSLATGSPVPHPPVFRPQFLTLKDTNNPTRIGSVTIVGFTNDAPANVYPQINKQFLELTNMLALSASSPADVNYYGVPWVVGAVTGIPQFDKFSYQSQIYMARQLQFIRNPTNGIPGNYSTSPPFQYTNQFYELAMTNIFGMSAWNPYTNNYFGSSNGLYVIACYDYNVILTNNYNWGTTLRGSNYSAYKLFAGGWPGWPKPDPKNPPPVPSQFSTILSGGTNLPAGYFSDTLNTFITNVGGMLNVQPSDTNQTKYPSHLWSTTVTNHMYYALFDGNPLATPPGQLLDFVNLGPFGNAVPITYDLTNAGNSLGPNPWIVTNSSGSALNIGNGQLSSGELNQISNAFIIPGSQFYSDYTGTGTPAPITTQSFCAPGSAPPPGMQENLSNAVMSVNYIDSNTWMACDPFVHYTLGDLYSPSQPGAPAATSTLITNLTTLQLSNGLTLDVANLSTRYKHGVSLGSVPTLNSLGNMIYADPGMTNANMWQFPTGIFPTVGWLGRIHRGTPWQTVYLKSDFPAQQPAQWALTWVNSTNTYPTNDWSLLDLFTTAPNDNAARGLLSVNQTNEAAWAAALAGVIAMTDRTNGVAINPTSDVNYVMGSFNNTFTNNIGQVVAGVNTFRQNTIFHNIGGILGASSLTVNSPFLTNFLKTNSIWLSDEMVERIPQQIAGLLKVGLPQFAIYSWGQSLKPKSLYSAALAPAALNNICTNYEITGEFETRTVCHLKAGDPTAANPKIVVDSFNIVPGN